MSKLKRDVRVGTQSAHGMLARGEYARAGESVRVVGRTAAASKRETGMGQTMVECVYNGKTIYVDQNDLG